jgi:hypothetical protein
MDDEEQTDYIRIHRIKLKLTKIEWAINGPPKLTKLMKKRRKEERRKPRASKCATPLIFTPYILHSKTLILTIRADLAAVSEEIELVLDVRTKLYLQSEYHRIRGLFYDYPDPQALALKAQKF